MTGLFESRTYSDVKISDFVNLSFQNAFKQYFAELDVNVRDWDGLFKEMNDEGGNVAFVRIDESGEIVGFILLKPIKFTSWFFEENCGFIREFWVAEKCRNNGHGTALISLAEKHLIENDIYTSILTTDTAERFYDKHGYIKALGCKAKNKAPVFVKHLR